MQNLTCSAKWLVILSLATRVSASLCCIISATDSQPPGAVRLAMRITSLIQTQHVQPTGEVILAAWSLNHVYFLKVTWTSANTPLSKPNSDRNSDFQGEIWAPAGSLHFSDQLRAITQMLSEHSMRSLAKKNVKTMSLHWTENALIGTRK